MVTRKNIQSVVQYQGLSFVVCVHACVLLSSLTYNGGEKPQMLFSYIHLPFLQRLGRECHLKDPPITNHLLCNDNLLVSSTVTGMTTVSIVGEVVLTVKI